jgi:hypothetical protein
MLFKCPFLKDWSRVLFLLMDLEPQRRQKAEKPATSIIPTHLESLTPHIRTRMAKFQELMNDLKKDLHESLELTS